MKLTEYQKEFLLENFFRDEKFAGWRNIAEKLIENGSCIVPGNECIWKGGIGNFISTKPSDSAVGCLEYVFSLRYFLSSNYFEEVKDYRLEELTIQKIQTERKLNELKQL